LFNIADWNLLNEINQLLPSELDGSLTSPTALVQHGGGSAPQLGGAGRGQLGVGSLQHGVGGPNGSSRSDDTIRKNANLAEILMATDDQQDGLQGGGTINGGMPSQAGLGSMNGPHAGSMRQLNTHGSLSMNDLQSMMNGAGGGGGMASMPQLGGMNGPNSGVQNGPMMNSFGSFQARFSGGGAQQGSPQRNMGNVSLQSIPVGMQSMGNQSGMQQQQLQQHQSMSIPVGMQSNQIGMPLPSNMPLPYHFSRQQQQQQFSQQFTQQQQQVPFNVFSGRQNMSVDQRQALANYGIRNQGQQQFPRQPRGGTVDRGRQQQVAMIMSNTSQRDSSPNRFIAMAGGNINAGGLDGRLLMNAGVPARHPASFNSVDVLDSESKANSNLVRNSYDPSLGAAGSPGMQNGPRTKIKNAFIGGVQSGLPGSAGGIIRSSLSDAAPGGGISQNVQDGSVNNGEGFNPFNTPGAMPGDMTQMSNNASSFPGGATMLGGGDRSRPRSVIGPQYVESRSNMNGLPSAERGINVRYLYSIYFIFFFICIQYLSLL